jgi:hypothetical protein
MDTEQRERIKDFEERQKRIEKREKFRRIVFGTPDGLEFYDFLGVFALPIFLVRIIGGLITFFGIMFFSNRNKKGSI